MNETVVCLEINRVPIACSCIRCVEGKVRCDALVWLKSVACFVPKLAQDKMAKIPHSCNA